MDIIDYINESDEHKRKYFTALVNGYQVEKSPEELALATVREYYDRLKELSAQAHGEADHDRESEFLSEQTGVIMALNLLGITIEGVNA